MPSTFLSHGRPRLYWSMARHLTTLRDQIGLLKTYGQSPTLQELYGEKEITGLTRKITNDLPQYPRLKSAVQRSQPLQQALILTYGAFGQAQRENRNEPIVWHSMDLAEQIVRLFGPRATPVIAKTLLHDVKEDCKIADQTISRLFLTSSLSLGSQKTNLDLGREVADGVERLTHTLKLPPGTDWEVKTQAKLEDKLQRAPHLTADELAIRMVDNNHEVRSNAEDFATGLLRCEPPYVVRVLPKTQALLEEFQAKLNTRSVLNDAYGSLLSSKGKIEIADHSLDCAQMARDLSGQFEAARLTQQHYIDALPASSLPGERTEILLKNLVGEHGFHPVTPSPLKRILENVSHFLL